MNIKHRETTCPTSVASLASLALRRVGLDGWPILLAVLPAIVLRLNGSG